MNQNIRPIAAARAPRERCPPAGPPTPTEMVRGGRSASVVDDERHHQVDLVLGDLVVLDVHALLLDPGAADIPEGLRRAGDPLLDGVLEALRGGGADLRDTGDGHSVLSFTCGSPHWSGHLTAVDLHPSHEDQAMAGVFFRVR